jgi:hypothetical protein
MAAPGQKALGVTAPLSTAPPTPADLKADTDLVTELKRQNNFENTDETQKRYVLRLHTPNPGAYHHPSPHDARPARTLSLTCAILQIRRPPVPSKNRR